MIMIVSPAAGGVAHVAGAVANRLRTGDERVSHHRVADDESAFQVCRTAWAARREIRAARVLHLELGRSAVGAFWFGLVAALLRGRHANILVAHDMPVLVKSPGAGLITTRPGLRDAIAYRILAPLLDRPLVATLRSRVARTLVFSDSAAESATGRRWPDVSVIAHGAADPTVDAPPPSLGRHVLMAGYLAPDKGLDLLLDAWDRLDTALPLVIAGAAHRQAEHWLAGLQSRRTSRPDAIRWLGAVDEATFTELIATAAIVVLPYRVSNPASGILVRALVEGRAVVATRVPAALAEIRHDDTGLLVDVEDLNGLTVSLAALLRDRPTRDRLGSAAQRDAVARHSWSNHVDQIRATYHRVAGARP